MTGGGGAEVVEHAEHLSYYVGNVTAEMATVLRKEATILIRLREKMSLHLCTVFIRLAIQSLCNATRPNSECCKNTEEIQQQRIRNVANYIHEHDWKPRFCTSCKASTYSGSLLRKRIHVAKNEM